VEAYWPEAIVIVGLGDYAPGNTRHIDLLAERLRERYGHPIVEACAMTPRRPQLSEVFAKCINRSARRILVVPYAFELDTDDFSVLAMATHEVSRKLEGVRVFIGEPIGLDDSLVRLVDQSVRESSELPDIRELSL
jgi:sirohydrochlorin ferrochelatase